MAKIRFSRTERAQAVRLACRLMAHEALEFPSSSNPKVTYRAVVQVDGKVLCNCRGWTLKREGQPRRCAHTDTLVGDRETVTRGDFLYVVAGTA